MINPKRRLIVVVVLLTISFGLYWTFRLRGYVARKGWTEQARPEIGSFADNPTWVKDEIALLNTGKSTSNQNIIADFWLSDRMILMASGEWLIYKSHCVHASPRQIGDIFLAKGSNGRWYYSAWHFCVHMCALTMLQEVPPPDLATFATRYQLNDFDGFSEERSQSTQTFPSLSQSSGQTYTSDHRPGLPDLSCLLRSATAAISIATNSDPDLTGHVLTVSAIRYEHQFPQPDRPTGVTYEAIYCDSTLKGGNATGINIEVSNNVAFFKTQKGRPLWSCVLQGQPSVPESVLVQIARQAFTRFWPKISSDQLTLDEIVCCDPIGENKFSVTFRFASPYAAKSSASAHSFIEINISTNGTVAEDDIQWTLRKS